MHAGFEDAAVGFLMRYLATYPLHKLTPKEAESPQAPLSDGCRLSLECLKLGPPAGRPSFSEQTGARCSLQAADGAPRSRCLAAMPEMPHTD